MRARLTRKSVQMATAAILSGAFLVACGQQASTSSQPPKPATQQPGNQQSGNQSGNQQPSSFNTIPANGAAYPNLAAANMNILLNATMPQSLVNIVKSAGKQVGVFEFVGVSCLACKTESPEAAAQLAPYADQVTRIAVFPNAANQYTASEYQNFINMYSQGARYAVDNDLALLKTIRYDASQYFGIFVIVKSDGTGVVLNQNGLARMLPAVQAALNGK